MYIGNRYIRTLYAHIQRDWLPRRRAVSDALPGGGAFGRFPPGSCRLSRSCVQVLVIYPIHKRKNTYPAQYTGNWLHVTWPLCVALFSP